MIKPKKIAIIPLFIMASFFLARQTQSLDSAVGLNKIEYKAETQRDPFQEETIGKEEGPVQAGPLPSVTIQGMVWGGALPQAIINNKVVKVGDTIEQMQILEIGKNGIIVLYGNQKHNLSAPSANQAEIMKKKSGGGTP